MYSPVKNLGSAKWLWQAALLGLWVHISLFSCSDPPPLKLTLKQREWVDTLYLRQVEGLSAQMDSACEEKRRNGMQAMVDSIVIARKDEEELLRAKYRQ